MENLYHLLGAKAEVCDIVVRLQNVRRYEGGIEIESSLLPTVHIGHFEAWAQFPNFKQVVLIA